MAKKRNEVVVKVTPPSPADRELDEEQNEIDTADDKHLRAHRRKHGRGSAASGEI
jgi:hypothetical protein